MHRQPTQVPPRLTKAFVHFGAVAVCAPEARSLAHRGRRTLSRRRSASTRSATPPRRDACGPAVSTPTPGNEHDRREQVQRLVPCTARRSAPRGDRPARCEPSTTNPSTFSPDGGSATPRGARGKARLPSCSTSSSPCRPRWKHRAAAARLTATAGVSSGRTAVSSFQRLQTYTEVLRRLLYPYYTDDNTCGDLLQFRPREEDTA
jgi:hypothetical protein